jgi:phage baseplate assembly protein W
MAQYKEININTNRTNVNNATKVSQFYKGTSTVNQTSKSFSLYDMELIKQDILNHFNIRKGEKIYNPDFGTIIWASLYEPLTEQTRQAIMDDVTAIVQSDPRVKANDITIQEKGYGLAVQIDLEFAEFGKTETMRLAFDRDNGIVAT